MHGEIGKILVIVGIAVVCMGLVIWTGVGRGWIGKLPGDISVSRPNFSFHFPIATCILISLVLTVIMWLFRK